MLLTRVPFLSSEYCITLAESIIEKLGADLALFRKAFNQRVLFFRQLQEISDSVAEVEFNGTREDALHDSEKEKKDMDAQLTAKRAHQRYLENLVKSNEDDELDEDDKCCILCRCDFERGFLTNWWVFHYFSVHRLEFIPIS